MRHCFNKNVRLNEKKIKVSAIKMFRQIAYLRGAARVGGCRANEGNDGKDKDIHVPSQTIRFLYVGQSFDSITLPTYWYPPNVGGSAVILRFHTRYDVRVSHKFVSEKAFGFYQVCAKNCNNRTPLLPHAT